MTRHVFGGPIRSGGTVWRYCIVLQDHIEVRLGEST